MKVFVVYWVDLDNDCLKKSEVEIIGVFDNKEQAQKLVEDYDHEGYCEDSRCYYTTFKELILNEIPISVINFIKDKKGFDPVTGEMKCDFCQKWIIKEEFNFKNKTPFFMGCKDCHKQIHED